MIGYNKQEAASYIKSGLTPSHYASLSTDLELLIMQAIEGDLKYMALSGVIDEEGLGGDVYYDEDDAFEFVLEHLVQTNHFTPDQAMATAVFLNDFMELQYIYMEKKGLVQTD